MAGPSVSLLLVIALSSSSFPVLLNGLESQNCINCIDSSGKNCDDYLRRYGKTKYWILKGSGTPSSLEDAKSQCSAYGKVVAHAQSDAEISLLKTLASEAGFSAVWTENGDNQPITITEGGNDERSGRATVCQYPEGHPCISDKPPKTENNDKTKSPTSNSSCPQPLFGEGNQLIPTGPNSKYLYPKVKMFGSWEEGQKLCESHGLELGSVQTLKDYFHLKDDWIGKNRFNIPKSSSFYATLGFKLDESSGELSGANSGSPVTLQLFNSYAPLEPGCVALQASQGNVLFASVACNNQNLMPLCQYKRDSECYKTTPLAIHESELTDGLLGVGSTEKRIFYGSRLQKSWNDAKAFCERAHLKLLDFTKDDPKETNAVWQVISKYQEMVNYPNLVIKSWTSGTFKNGFQLNKNFAFESNGEVWSGHDIQGHFSFYTVGTRDPMQERCISVAGPQILKPTLCDCLNYFMCYKNKNVTNATSGLTTTAPPSNLSATTTEPSEVSTAKPSKCKGDLIQLSFSPSGFTEDEVMGLIQLSENLNFSRGYSDIMKIKEESSWRVAHVKNMGSITKQLCPEPFVTEEFVNVLMNLIMVYYNSVSENPRSGASKRMWKKLLRRYEKCKNISDPFSFKTRGGIIIQVDAGSLGTEEIRLLSEVVDDDKVFALDIVMEGLWYMFQVTAGACYNIAQWKTTWLAEYFYNFRVDFVEPFKDWWISPGINNYGLLFGDTDLYTDLYNMRACAVAGFIRLNIVDRLPVRPLSLNSSDFVMPDLNMRLVQ